jgi:5'-nucleotidase
MEAALQGLPAIALSQYMGPLTDELSTPFEAAIAHGQSVVERLLRDAPWDSGDYRLFYNVNFPPVAGADVKGLRVAPKVTGATRFSASKRRFRRQGASSCGSRAARSICRQRPGTDAAVNLEGYISVTPMRADLTAHNDLAAVTKALE